MIRELRKDDKEVFISMAQEFYCSKAVLHNIPIENIINTFDEIISGSPYVKAYLIEEQGETAGYGLISLTYSNEAGGLVIWIEELHIVKDYRGLGLGGKFMDFIEAEFSADAKRFRLEVSRTNKSVQNLYADKGYTTLEYLQMVYDV